MDITYKINRQGLTKEQIFNQLLVLDENIMIKTIDDINDAYGYTFIDKYELSRYKMYLQNKGIELNQNLIIRDMLKSERKRPSRTHTDKLKKDMMKGYMTMYSNMI